MSDEQEERSARIQSFAEFWPYYMREHSDARCRVLHFIGTSGFLCLFFAQSSLVLLAALSAALVFGWRFFQVEATQPAFWVIAGVAGLPLWAEPSVGRGILFAYACAWVGHFILEKNRPATFKYPLWSLAADFRMWSEMCRGKYWRMSSPLPIPPQP